ncbi:hypothetical protein SAMN04488074_101235 [Lentzea albidocapillata subsp. violacea]|uniref:Uncharacterized protein n=1 Tax=Lentzea albidocapillata subsp. violacea TaxID=128104 RepID=A0A1G8Q643_9PSEU|nr:hypothetical protein [Lentzea albidocapillata]SDI99550.1 hypothetical protein SAMN04488074_101235 [Lentzea albidocapillata subsp. violacea]
MQDVDKASALTILTMEHNTLQMIRTATITDATGRAGHLLTTISASMIALGFVAQVVTLTVLLTLLLVVFTALFLIGLATLFRTVELAIEDFQAGLGINRIRAVYAELEPSTRDAFVRQLHDDTLGVEVDGGQTGWRKARRPRLLGTALGVPGLVNLVNGVNAGVVAGAVAGLLNAGLTLAIVIGAVVALVVICGFGVALDRIGRRGLAPISTRYPRNHPN